MVGITNRHHLITNKLPIAKIEYPHLGDKDLSNLVKGKKKKGGMKTKWCTTVCQITCENGQVYMIRAMTTGNIIEVNEKILANPNLLLTNVSFFSL